MPTPHALQAAGRPPWRRRSKLLAALAPALLAASIISAIPVAADGPAADSRAARYEVHFMTHMIDHHHMAVMMSAVCVEEPDIEPELREMCEMMLADQQAEIQLMQTWLQDWYGMPYAPQMMPGHMDMMAELAALDGDRFEIAFLRSMPGHHLDAVREGRRCLERAGHEELADLCGRIMTSQLQEVEVMRSWLCDWHGVCRSQRTLT